MSKISVDVTNWVYDPDASLDATADWKMEVDECDENNNTLRFFALG